MTTQVEGDDVEEAPDDRSEGSGRRAVRTFRILITVAAVVLFY